MRLTLDNVLTWDQPFGPNATEKIAQDLFREILDDSNSAYYALRTRPFLIVGRRGSGKTSMLSAIRLTGQFGLVVDVPHSIAFQKIMDLIDQSNNSSVIDETVGEAWNKVIWNFVFLKAHREFNNSNQIQCAVIGRYLTRVGMKPNSLPGQLMQLLFGLLKKDSSAAQHAVEALNNILDANSTFADAQFSVGELLKKTKTKCVVLIDNIENIDLSKEPMRKSISGLLIAIDKFKDSTVPIDVRCSIPAEIFPKLSELAANSDKSLDSKLVLHWSSSELTHMAAIRYKEFLRHYAPSDLFQAVSHMDLSKPKALDDFIHRFFPRKVKNGEGYSEYTLRYIIRHTQLLPRQFITYLNEIARQSFNNRISDDFSLSPESIINGIREQEGLVCQGVFSGYRMVYPEALKVCKILLPELSLTFSYGDFQRLFRRFKGRLYSKEGVRLFESEGDCLAMLTEIGAVGVKVSEDDEYISAEFSYNLPLNLATRYDDVFCLHPAFSGSFRSQVDKDSYKPIFPKLG